MIITDELKNKKILIEDFYNVNHDYTLLGVLSKKLPKDIISYIIDLAEIRFTTYSLTTSDYYKYKIESLVSWPKWRKRNGFPVYEVSKVEIEALKKYARREIHNEKLSLLIYGF